MIYIKWKFNINRKCKIKKLLLFASVFSLPAGMFAQTYQVERCATVQYVNYRENLQPGYLQSINETFETAKTLQKANQEKSNETYVIPVVVHIVYNKPEENLADSVIHNQINILNEDYNRLNADTVNMRPDFIPHVGYANIQFRLAEYDPDGNPTTGITRTKTDKTTFLEDPLSLLAGDMSSLEQIKETDNGGISPWDQSRYLNIWVGNMSITLFGSELPPVLLGYATPPANLPNWPPGSTGEMNDGVVVQYHCFGSNNPNTFEDLSGQTYISYGRTAVHEVGHYLGLRHIWGDGDCSEEDGIDDTPNANSQSESDCNTNKNTCVDDIDGVDLPDMVENYMDYSAETCQNTFTAGQVQLMRSVLENQRLELVQNNPSLNIEKELSLKSIIYPNPASSTITVELSKQTDGELIIFDLNGRLVQKTPAKGKIISVNIDNLQKGIYQLIVSGTPIKAKLVKL